MNTTTSNATHPEENDLVDEETEEGIVRRYLLQDAKVNSTLKVGILMVQLDGERNYSAPALKSATMFNTGISGIIMTGNENMDPHEASKVGGAVPSINKTRDTSEAQDMYRRALAASWNCQHGELPADECIESIFAGGSGFCDSGGDGGKQYTHSPALRTASSPSDMARTSSSGSLSGSSDDVDTGGNNATSTLRPRDVRRMQAQLQSHQSNLSDMTITASSNITSSGARNPQRQQQQQQPYRLSPQSSQGPFHRRRRHDSGGSGGGGVGAATSVMGQNALLTIHKEESGMSVFDESASLAPTAGSSGTHSDRSGSGGSGGGGAAKRGRAGGAHGGFGGRRREIDEYDVRDDLVAWKLPGTVV